VVLDSPLPAVRALARTESWRRYRAGPAF